MMEVKAAQWFITGFAIVSMWTILGNLGAQALLTTQSIKRSVV